MPKSKYRCEVTPEDIIAAKRLCRFVLELDGRVTNHSQTRWVAELAVLRRKLDDPADLERVLGWYVANFQRLRKVLPVISSATQFVARWNWIVDRMERDGK